MTAGDWNRKTALGRIRSVVTVREFSSLATCYPEPTRSIRPKAAIKCLARQDLLSNSGGESWSHQPNL
jgi:hypothetical protein